MNHVAIAIALHLAAIVIWIGGVGFVTTIMFPAIRRDYPPEARLAAFARIEHAFVWQARGAVLLAGASGVWMIAQLDWWAAFAQPSFWWLHAMVCLWVVFATMLFVIEPFFLHRRLQRTTRPAQLFDRMERAHRVLFALSIATVLAGAAGSHGL